MFLLLSTALGAPWHGTVNDAVAAQDVRIAAPFDMAWLAEKLHAHVDPDLTALPDTVTLLYGDPSTNPALAKVLAFHHIVLDAEGVTLGDARLAIPDPFLIAALPNPEHPEVPVVVYTAWQADAQPKLNRTFHGPTPITLGTTVNGLVGNWSGDWRAAGDGHLLGLAVGAGVLTPAEALEDLQVLTSQLERGWAGLEDLDAELGGGWAARVENAKGRLVAQERWTWKEVWAVYTELLSPVRDAHFTLEGSAITAEGRPTSASRRFTPGWRPYFADGRVTGGAGTWTLDGAPIPDVPPVPGPHDVVLGVPYRFPTVLADGSRAWLLGEFATSKPGPLAIGGLALPLHPSRSEHKGRRDPWTLAGDVLSVTTMKEASLDGLAATAKTLRERSRIVLDLRGNGGGSDHPAQDWITTLHAGPYRWTPGVQLRVGDGPRAQRQKPWSGATLGKKATRRTAYAGRLQVLTDSGIASSGETFVQLAAQVPNAVVYGTPTAGCSRYGNLVTQAPLPHTQIVATFGHTAFHWDAVRPVVEGVGIFPDVWLDEADPVAFVQGLP